MNAANADSLTRCVEAAAAEIDDTMDRPADQVAAAATWRFVSAMAAADPGPGGLAWDHSSAPAVTELYLSATDADGGAPELDVLAVGDLLVHSAAGYAPEVFAIDAAPVDNGGWWTVPANLTGAAVVLPYAYPDDTLVAISAMRPSALAGGRLALANRVNIVRAVEWWKANDAAFGVLGSTDLGPVRAPKDSFARHALELVPLKARWGCA